MIITFANHKGGVGKTTLAVITAETLTQEGKQLRMYDLDSQRNFTEKMTDWLLESVDQFATVDIKTALDDQVNAAGSYTVIDTAPGLDDNTKQAIAIADVIVVPVIAESDSIKGLADILQLKPKGKIFVVHNNYDRNWAYDKKAHDSYVAMVEKCAAQGAKIELLTLPRDRFLTGNLEWGENWCKRLNKPMAESIYAVYDKIIATTEQEA